MSRNQWSDLSGCHAGILADVLPGMPVRIPAWQPGRPLHGALVRRTIGAALHERFARPVSAFQTNCLAGSPTKTYAARKEISGK
jgi:hypothetical protein